MPNMRKSCLRRRRQRLRHRNSNTSQNCELSRKRHAQTQRSTPQSPRSTKRHWRSKNCSPPWMRALPCQRKVLSKPRKGQLQATAATYVPLPPNQEEEDQCMEDRSGGRATSRRIAIKSGGLSDAAKHNGGGVTAEEECQKHGCTRDRTDI